MPAGRPPGSKDANRRALLARLREEFPEWNPVVEMAKGAMELTRLAQDDPKWWSEAIAATDRVTSYITPKLKAMEVTGRDGAPLEVVLSQAGDDAL